MDIDTFSRSILGLSAFATSLERASGTVHEALDGS
jgi:hypothetical protein